MFSFAADGKHLCLLLLGHCPPCCYGDDWHDGNGIDRGWISGVMLVVNFWGVFCVCRGDLCFGFGFGFGFDGGLFLWMEFRHGMIFDDVEESPSQTCSVKQQVLFSGAGCMALKVRLGKAFNEFSNLNLQLTRCHALSNHGTYLRQATTIKHFLWIDLSR